MRKLSGTFLYISENEEIHSSNGMSIYAHILFLVLLEN